MFDCECLYCCIANFTQPKRLIHKRCLILHSLIMLSPRSSVCKMIINDVKMLSASLWINNLWSEAEPLTTSSLPQPTTFASDRFPNTQLALRNIQRDSTQQHKSWIRFLLLSHILYLLWEPYIKKEKKHILEVMAIVSNDYSHCNFCAKLQV